MNSKLIFRYAGICMVFGGMVWFGYLHFTAETRMANHAAASTKISVELPRSVVTREATPEVAMIILSRKAADEIQEMLFPFLLVINGFSFCLIGLAKKEERVAVE